MEKENDSILTDKIEQLEEIIKKQDEIITALQERLNIINNVSCVTKQDKLIVALHERFNIINEISLI